MPSWDSPKNKKNIKKKILLAKFDFIIRPDFSRKVNVFETYAEENDKNRLHWFVDLYCLIVSSRIYLFICIFTLSVISPSI